MAHQEIEHKFRVTGDFKPFVTESHEIIQGYISQSDGRTTRVRIKDGKGYLTIKGPLSADGLSRFEWETEISVEDARELYTLCLTGKIEKTRHIVPVGDHIYEVDEFHGANEGLVIAEVELKSVDESFDKPSWLGRDVSMDPRFRNSYISAHPFPGWASEADIDPRLVAAVMKMKNK